MHTYKMYLFTHKYITYMHIIYIYAFIHRYKLTHMQKYMHTYANRPIVYTHLFTRLHSWA